MNIEEFIQHRKYLHQYPELSGKEKLTSEYIKDYIKKKCPISTIANVASNGVLVTFQSKKKGKHILFRCELDALPILELNKFDYKSKENGVAHLCGHDGHMTIMLAVATYFQENELEKGKLSLLFQPAEENGEGAKSVLDDLVFKTLCKPDFVFALHNVPGFDLHSIIIKPENFTPSVVSIKIKLIGKTSHAAEPEKGINPSLAVSEILIKAKDLQVTNQKSSSFGIITPIFIKVGSESFGISAGLGEIGFTLRTFTNFRMRDLKERLLEVVLAVSHAHKLTYKVEWLEEFSSIKNNKECVQIIQEAAQKNIFPFAIKTEPFKWGEDFGLFTEKYKGAMFAIGAGIDKPALHNPDYDFPDELIQTGRDMFVQIVKNIQDE
jgi:amidohydrolase